MDSIELEEWHCLKLDLFESEITKVTRRESDLIVKMNRVGFFLQLFPGVNFKNIEGELGFSSAKFQFYNVLISMQHVCYSDKSDRWVNMLESIFCNEVYKVYVTSASKGSRKVFVLAGRQKNISTREEDWVDEWIIVAERAVLVVE